MLLFAGHNLPFWWVFRASNAPIHLSNDVRDWFRHNSVNLMTWPVHSPDLNRIESLWEWMPRKVYDSNRAYNHEKKLTECVFSLWDDIPKEPITSLISSVHHRTAEVLERQERYTRYLNPTLW